MTPRELYRKLRAGRDVKRNVKNSMDREHPRKACCLRRALLENRFRLRQSCSDDTKDDVKK